jgi:HEAT repeat protein/DNA-binding winged helix-turn-helix (wHTH) protein
MPVYRFGKCVFDTDTELLLCNGEAVELEPAMYEALAKLVIRAPKPVEYAELSPGNEDDRLAIRAVHSLIYKVRDKISDPAPGTYIRTVRNQGYRFLLPPRTQESAAEHSEADGASTAGPAPHDPVSSREALLGYLRRLIDAAEHRGVGPYLSQLKLRDIWLTANLAPANRARSTEAESNPGGAMPYWDEEFSAFGTATPEASAERWPALRKRIRRGVIIADAGLGKSTLLLAEAQETAREALALLTADAPPSAEVEIPIYARLDDVAEGLRLGNDLFAALAQAALAAPDGILDMAIREGRVALLLDGLDELPAGQRSRGLSPRDRVEDALNLVMEGEDAHRIRVLVASRMQGYRPPWRLRPSPEEDELELLPLAATDVGPTLAAWLGDDALAAAAARYLRENPQVTRLGQNPLFLTFLYTLIRAAGVSRVDGLPRSRAELYEGMLTEFVRGTWRQRERQRLDSPGAIEQTLRRIEAAALSLATTDGGWLATFGADRLYTALECDSAEVLDDVVIRAGVFTQLAKPAWGEVVPYTFVHRSLHEYLVARALSHGGVEGAVARVGEHLWFEPEWEHVLVFLAARLPKPDLLVKRILDEPDDAYHQMAILAARCLAEAGSRIADGELLKAAALRCSSALLSRSPLNRQRAAVAGGGLPTVGMVRVGLHLGRERIEATEGGFELLRHVRFPGALPELLTAAESTTASVRVAAAAGLGAQSDEAACERLVMLLWDKEPEVAFTAAVALGNHRSSIAFEELLKMISDTGWRERYRGIKSVPARSSRAWEVAQAAARSAGAIAGERIEALVALARPEEDGTEQLVAIALDGCPGPEATQALAELIRGGSPQARSQALRALRSRPSDEKVAGSVREAILNGMAGASESQRLDALGTLAIVSNALPDALQTLLTGRVREPQSAIVDGLREALRRAASEQQLLAISESDSSWIRTLAASLLGGRGPSAVSRLETMLSSPNDEYWYTRVAAAHAFAVVRGPVARRVLQRVSMSDPDYNVRTACVESLGAIGQLASVPTLGSILTNEAEDHGVRAAAARALGRIGGEVAAEVLAGQGVAEFRAHDAGVDILAARLERGDLSAFDELVTLASSAGMLDSSQAYAVLARLAPLLARRDDWGRLRNVLAKVTEEFVYSEEWARRAMAHARAEDRRKTKAESASRPPPPRKREQDDGEPEPSDGQTHRYTSGRTGGDWDGIMNRIEGRRQTAIVHELKERDWEAWKDGRLLASFQTEREALAALGSG